jgi:ATP-dependent Clp protease protease subunit
LRKIEYERVNPVWDSGNYVLMENIDDKSCLDAINFIQYHNLKESPLDSLTLVVNTPGGSVSAAFALIDVMKTSKIPVDTLAIGSIASCGVLITMAGRERSISENCMVMSHQYSWGSSGKHQDLLSARKAQDITHERILNHYHRCTKKSRKFIEKNLLPHEDVWLTPPEAVGMGIVDSITKIY